MTPVSTLIILFSIATAVAILVRHLRLPYTVALVLVGLGLGAAHLVAPPHLTKELLFAVFLPGLLFEAAFHLDGHEVARNKLTIATLAVPGVVIAIVLTGIVTTLAFSGLDVEGEFTWRAGLVFGAVIAATDPIAVTAVFRDLHAPLRLRTLVEGESLVNDGTAVVLFGLILAFVGGAESSVGGLLLSFVQIVGGGVVIGLVISLLLSQVIRHIDDPMIEITITMIAAYGAFVAAEHFHTSGVIATVTAGLVCGHYARRTLMSPATQVAVGVFWEYLAFALNSVVFLLIGFEIDIRDLQAAWLQILVAYLAVLASRAGVVTFTTVLLQRTKERLPFSWISIITWGGLRGALSMVLVLSLAIDFPHRQLLITMTFGVVLVTLLVQGITMPLLMRRLGLVGEITPPAPE